MISLTITENVYYDAVLLSCLDLLPALGITDVECDICVEHQTPLLPCFVEVEGRTPLLPDQALNRTFREFDLCNQP